jgi:hypothetical protein
MAAFFVCTSANMSTRQRPMNTPSPAIISNLAVRRMPRHWLVLLCVVYVFIGSFDRGPWKSMDLTSLGYMLSLVEGQSHVLHLQMAGIPPELDALLPYWIGMLAIRTFSDLPPDLSARLVFSSLSLWGMFCLWQGIYFLARNPQAQPVAFAFGGEANPKDYARAIADGGLLAYVACLGLAVPSHEITPMAFQLQLLCMFFAGAACMHFYPGKGLTGICAGAFLMALSGAPALATLLLSGICILWWRNPQSTRIQLQLLLSTLAGVIFLSFYLELWQWRVVDLFEFKTKFKENTELLLWFLWPAWPMAAWTLWKWRGHWRHQVWTQHLTLPVFLFTVTLGASVVTSNPDRTLLLVLPSIAALAAFSLPTLRRSVAALVDWFTLIFFTTCAIAIWGVWFSLETGVPAQPARNVFRLVPGYVYEFNLFALLCALVVTLIWFKIIAWRVGRHPSAIWKSLVLPATGVVLCWVLLMTLWLPFIDHAMSYKAWTAQLKEVIGSEKCVAFARMDRHQIAGFSFHGKLSFEPMQQPNTCQWLLHKPLAGESTPMTIDTRKWLYLQTLQRPGDKSDSVQIYQRIDSLSHD